MVLELVQLPWTVHEDLLTAFTDFMIVMTPLLIYLMVGFDGGDPKALTTGYMLITYLSFAATLIGWGLSDAGSRFQAPPVIAITGSWILAAAPGTLLQDKHRKLIRATAWLMVIVLLPAILAARSRTSLIAWFAAALFAFLAPGVKLRARIVPLLIVGLLASVTLVASQSQLTSSSILSSAAEQARLNAIASGHTDVSGETRLLEISDVRGTMRREGGPFDQLLGFGHGASYVPQESDIVANVEATTGRVHNIHVTPFTIWFRYGYIGLALFLILLSQALIAAIRIMRREHGLFSMLNLLSLLLYFIELTLFNATADPAFSFVLGVSLAANRRYVREPGGGWHGQEFTP
jgi:hypothetical protein